MQKSKIPWCDYTINPFGWGCYGPGGTAAEPKRCSYCYAYRLAKRKLTKCPLCRQFIPHVHPYEFDKVAKLRKPSRIFTQSMGDIFGAGHDHSEINFLWAIMSGYPQHDFIILTKEPKRAAEYFRNFETGDLVNHWQSRGRWPLPNVWLLVSVEGNKDRHRIETLLTLPAAVRGISYEPALEPLNVSQFLPPYGEPDEPPSVHVSAPYMGPWLDWVIIGDQTGPRAKPMPLLRATHAAWACQAAGVPLFYKHGPDDFGRVGDMPTLLGRKWDQFPEVRHAAI